MKTRKETKSFALALRLRARAATLLIALLCCVTGAWADEVTVYEDATGSIEKVPVYGWNVNNYQKSEFVIPADQLEAMDGGTISQMTFYMKTSATIEWAGTFQVFLKEVNSTTISDFSGTSGATTVYEGTLDARGSTMTIQFSSNYTYEGGNLLVGVYHTVTGGSYGLTSFYGETVTGASVQGNSSSSLASVTASQQDFIPKTTFTYTPGSSVAKPTDFTATLTPGNGTIADLSWTQKENTATAWVVEYSTNSDFSSAQTVNVNTTPSAHLTGLTAETTYYAHVKADYGSGNYSGWSSTVSFTPSDIIHIGSGTGTNSYLPFYNYNKNALSQQIYTVEELGTAGFIQSIDFYKQPNTVECNRTLDIYMVSTAKSSFSSNTDWIAVTVEDRVFSGTVSFDNNNNWTTITLGEPFFYDGLQNVAIIIDDNTGSWGNSTPFYAFTPATTNQALYVNSDATNYDPTNPSSYDGTLSSSKNQIRIHIEAMGDCMKPTGLAATGVTNNAATLAWTENGTATAWVVAYKTGDADFTETNADANPFTLTGLAAETEYTVKVRPACAENKWSTTVTFTTLANDAVPFNLSTTAIYANAATLNWTGAQNSYNVRYRSFSPAPDFDEDFEDKNEFANWTVISNNTANDVSSGYLGMNSLAKRNGDYGFRFSSFNSASDYNQYLISPDVSGAQSIVFYYKTSNGTEETFRVGYSTTGNDVADFNNKWEDEIKSSNTGWTEFKLNLPDGVKYVAINYYSQYKYYLYIDDITIKRASAGEWVEKNGVTSPLAITGLEPKTKYEWQVQGIYNSEPTDWSTAANFTTLESITLADNVNNSNTITEYNGKKVDVTLGRTLQTGGWNTFCVPFGISAENYATLQTILAAQSGSITVKELSSSSFNSSTGALTLNFANADRIEAGKPYLVKVSNNLNLATLPATIDAYIQANSLTIANPFKGVKISKDPVTVTTACANFVPVFSPTNLEGGNTNILFVTGGTTLTYPAADGNINGFRAYFLLHDLTASARAYTLSFDDGETTGIQTLDNLTIPPMGNSVHDLQGRRIEGQPTQKGVYIVNGKKTVIK